MSFLVVKQQYFQAFKNVRIFQVKSGYFRVPKFIFFYFIKYGTSQAPSKAFCMPIVYSLLVMITSFTTPT
jgi:hypothetical protein